jgi:parvulin-like peptidyl-prolyl isomerase
LFLALCQAALACKAPGEASRDTSTDKEMPAMGSSQVVSTVDRSVITLREVEELVLAGLPPDESLRRLQAQSLLMLEAERRGLQERMQVEQVGRQAAVQALLAREAQAVTVSEQELQASYDAQSSRFTLPERRVVAHVMARLSSKAGPDMDARAKAIAQRAIGGLAQTRELDAFLAAQKAQSAPGVEMIAERLPEVAHSQIPGPFGDAVFALREPGVVKAPVRSNQGWHAIRVLEILPKVTRVSLEQASAELRSELEQQKRAKRVAELITELRKQVPVTVVPNVLEELAAVRVD